MVQVASVAYTTSVWELFNVHPHVHFSAVAVPNWLGLFPFSLRFSFSFSKTGFIPLGNEISAATDFTKSCACLWNIKSPIYANI